MGYYSQQGVIFTISGASPTPTEQARIDDYLSKLPQPAPPPPPPGTMGSVEAGFRGAGADLATTAARVAYGLGAPETGQGILDYATAMRERTAREFQPRVSEFQQIGGLGDLASYLGTVGGQSVGYMIPGLAGAGIAALTAPASVPAALAGTVGYGAVAAPGFFGSNIAEQMEENKTSIGETAALPALGAAAAQTALDIITPAKLGVFARIGKIAGDPILAPIASEAEKRTWGEFVKQLPGSTVQAMLAESGTETLQEALAMYQSNPERLSNLRSEDVSRLANAAFGGAVLGGAFNIVGLQGDTQADSSYLDKLGQRLTSAQTKPLSEILAAKQQTQKQRDFVSQTEQKYKDTFAKDELAAQYEKEIEDILAGRAPRPAPQPTPQPPSVDETIEAMRGPEPAGDADFLYARNPNVEKAARNPLVTDFPAIYKSLRNVNGQAFENARSFGAVRNGLYETRKALQEAEGEKDQSAIDAIQAEIKKLKRPLKGVGKEELNAMYLRAQDVATSAKSPTLREEGREISNMITREFKSRENAAQAKKDAPKKEAEPEASAQAAPQEAPPAPQAAPSGTVKLYSTNGQQWSDDLQKVQDFAQKQSKDGVPAPIQERDFTAEEIAAAEKEFGRTKSGYLKTARYQKKDTVAAAPDTTSEKLKNIDVTKLTDEQKSAMAANALKAINEGRADSETAEKLLKSLGMNKELKEAKKASKQKAKDARPEFKGEAPAGPLKMYSSNGRVWSTDRDYANTFAKKDKVQLMERTFTPEELGGAKRTSPRAWTFASALGTPEPLQAAPQAPEAEAQVTDQQILEALRGAAKKPPEPEKKAEKKAGKKAKAEAKKPEAPKAEEKKAEEKRPEAKPKEDTKVEIVTAKRRVIAPTYRAANKVLNNMTPSELATANITGASGEKLTHQGIKDILKAKQAQRAEAPKAEEKPKKAAKKAEQAKPAEQPAPAEQPNTPQEKQADLDAERKIAADAEMIRKTIVDMSVGLRRFQAAKLRQEAEAERQALAADRAKARQMVIAAKLRRQAASRAIKALLDKVGMTNVRFEIVDTLSSNRVGDVVEALYDPNVTQAGKAIIKIADDVWSPDMTLDQFVQQVTGVAAHELLHHMKRAKAISGPEFRSLVKHARNTEAKMRGTKLGMTWMERAAVIERDPKLTKAQQAAQIERIEEEAVAEAFRDFVLNGAVAPPQPRSLFKRMLGWIRGLFAYKAADANQIFENILSGKYNDISYNLQATGPQTPYSRIQVQNFRKKGGTGVFEDMQRQTDRYAEGYRMGRGAVQRGLVLGETPQEMRERLQAEAQQRIAEEEAAKARSAKFEGRRMLPSLQQPKFSRIIADLGDKKKDTEYFGLRRFSGTLPDSIGVGPMEYNTPILNSVLDTKVETARPDDWIKVMNAWASVDSARQEELDDSGLIDMLQEEASSGTTQITQNDILNVLDAGQEKAQVLFSRLPNREAERLLSMRRSTLEDELAATTTGTQSPAQWIALLNSWVQKGKIKKEELDDRGLTEWLDGKAAAAARKPGRLVRLIMEAKGLSLPKVIKKSEIQDFLAFSRENSKYSTGPEGFKLRSRDPRSNPGFGYENYSIPGGEEYAVITFEGQQAIQTSEDHFNEGQRTQSFVRLKIRDIRVPDQAGEKSVKVVEIVEVQSDLHQGARRAGYKSEVSEEKAAAKEKIGIKANVLVEMPVLKMIGEESVTYDGLPQSKSGYVTNLSLVERLLSSTDPDSIGEMVEPQNRVGDFMQRYGVSLVGPRVGEYRAQLQEFADNGVIKNPKILAQYIDQVNLSDLNDSDRLSDFMSPFAISEIVEDDLDFGIDESAIRDLPAYESNPLTGRIRDGFQNARSYAAIAKKIRNSLWVRLGKFPMKNFEDHNFGTGDFEIYNDVYKDSTIEWGESKASVFSGMRRVNILWGKKAELWQRSADSSGAAPETQPSVRDFVVEYISGNDWLQSGLLSYLGVMNDPNMPESQKIDIILSGRNQDGTSAIPKSMIDRATEALEYEVTPEHFAFGMVYDQIIDPILHKYKSAVDSLHVASELEHSYKHLGELASTPVSIISADSPLRMNPLTEDGAKYVQRIFDTAMSFFESGSPMPDAPFKKSWPRNMLLAAIKYGISKGADGVLMDPGPVFIDRYHAHNDQRRSDGYKKFYDGDLPKVLKSIVGKAPSRIEPKFEFKGWPTGADVPVPYSIAVTPGYLSRMLHTELEATEALLEGIDFDPESFKVEKLAEDSPKFHYVDLSEKTKAEILGIRNTRYSRVAVDPALVRQIQNTQTHTAAVEAIGRAMSKTGLPPEWIKDKTDAAFQKFQDKMLPLGKIIDAVRKSGVEVPEEFDAYLQYSLMQNEITDRVRLLTENHVIPLTDLMKKAVNLNENDIASLAVVAPEFAEFVRESSSVNKGMVEAYGAALHAPERNDVGAQRNIESTDPGDLSASGFLTSEALAAQRWFRSHSQFAGIQKAHEALVALREEVNKIRDEFELSPDWNLVKPGKEFAAAGHPDGFKHMLPLRGIGDEDMDIDPNNPLDRKESEAIKTGRGWRTTGREDRAFLGRGTIMNPDGTTRLNRPPPLITEHLVQMAMQALIRGHKNRTTQALYGFLNTYGNQRIDYRGRNIDLNGLARIVHEAPMRRVLVDGVVKLLPDHGYKHADGMLITKIRQDDGNIKEVVIEVMDKRLRDALAGDNGYGSEDAGLVMSNIAKVTQFMAKMSTQWNPLFPLTNFPRDLAGAAINLQQYDMPGLTKQVMAGVPHAAKAIWRYQTHKGMAYIAEGKEAPRERYIVNGEDWTDTLELFMRSGGNFSVFNLTDIKELHNDINKKISPDATGFHGAWEGIKRFGDFIESYNKVVENSIRLATFKSFIDAGASAREAARAAQDVTTNYGRGGIHKSTMTALWMFYNANVQGNMTILNAMARSKRVRGVVGAVVLTGMFQDMMMALLGGEDDETGDNKYDRVPDYILESRMVFIDPTGETENGFFSFPMPFGYSSAHNFGRALSRYMRGGYTEGEAISTMFSSFVGSFNPLGGSESFWTFVSPTITDPFVELTLNKDFAGRPIYKPANPFEVEIPLSQRHWNNTSNISKFLTDTLHNLTGGGPTTPAGGGWTEWSPDVIDYLFRYYLGGVGAATGQAYSFITNTIPRVLAGEEWETREIPVVSKFFGNVGSQGDTKKFFEIMNEVKRVEKEIDIAKDSKDYDAIKAALEENRDMYRFSGAAKALGNQRKAISSRIRQIQNNSQIPEGRKSELIQPLMERMRDIEQRLIKQYNVRIRDAEVQ